MSLVTGQCLPEAIAEARWKRKPVNVGEQEAAF